MWLQFDRTSAKSFRAQTLATVNIRRTTFAVLRLPYAVLASCVCGVAYFLEMRE